MNQKLNKFICKRGHDKRIVGYRVSGNCAECSRIRERINYIPKYVEKKYGISYQTYLKLKESQNGCCAICGKHESILPKALCVEHNHLTGRVRGLVCTWCNMGLSFIENDLWEISARNYLATVLTRTKSFSDKEKLGSRSIKVSA
jgi:hypothetical protein